MRLFILFVSLVFILYSISSCFYEGDDWSECGNGGYWMAYQTKTLDTFYIQKEHLEWLPKKGKDYWAENSNGYKNKLRFDSDDIGLKTLNARYIPEDYDNCLMSGWDIAFVQNTFHSFSFDYIKYKVIISIRPRINYDLYDTVNKNSALLGEYLTLTVANKSISMAMSNAKSIINNQDTFETFEYFGKTYNNVIHCYVNNSNSKKVELSGFYYNLENKLIGYYLNNGEKWILY